MPVAGEVQDVGVDLLGEPAAGDAEHLGDLAPGECGLPGPQEELAGFPVEYEVRDLRLDQPAELACLGEPLVVRVAGQPGIGDIELRQLKLANYLRHAQTLTAPAKPRQPRLSPHRCAGQPSG